jgi:hypothetical protein
MATLAFVLRKYLQSNSEQFDQFTVYFLQEFNRVLGSLQRKINKA